MSEEVGEYEFTLLATLLNSNLITPVCAQHSKLKNEIHHEGILDSLEIALSDEELEDLLKEQKKKIIQVEHEYKAESLDDLDTYFSDKLSRQERDEKIVQALDEGHTQASIARHLELSPSAIVKIKNRVVKK